MNTHGNLYSSLTDVEFWRFEANEEAEDDWLEDFEFCIIDCDQNTNNITDSFIFMYEKYSKQYYM